MGKKDLSYFVRFGSLNLKKQKGYHKSAFKSTFHAPPAPKGFYAFPYIAQEMFLASSMDVFQPEQWPKKPKSYDKSYDERTESEQKELEEYDWEKLRKKTRKGSTKYAPGISKNNRQRLASSR